MRLLNDSSKLPKWLLKLAEHVAPRNESERRAQRMVAYIGIAVATALLIADILYRGW